MKRMINRLLRRVFGYELVAYNLQRQHDLRKRALFEALGVTLVLDLGANAGQYAAGLRAAGYAGRIVSVEPHPTAFAALTRRMGGDASWSGMQVALGAGRGEAELFTPPISEVSSLLPATGAGITGGWKSTRSVRVQVQTLDDLLPEVAGDGDVIYCKMDVQGSEAAVLDGGAGVLGRIAGFELEMSTVPLYAGEALFPTLLARLDRAGYDLFSMDTVLVDYRTGRLLQVEGVFSRRGPAERAAAPGEADGAAREYAGQAEGPVAASASP
jgi:FkbM family methyltransferase